MNDDDIRLDEQFYIVSDTARSATPSRVLKHGDSFGVFNPHGDAIPSDGGEQGLYHAGTRFLSHIELRFGRRRPLLLSSTISADNTLLAVDLTNPDILRDGRVVIPRGEIHVFRGRVLGDGTCAERIRVANHGLQPIEVPISIGFDADFADVFEVRGTRRAQRGTRLANVVADDLTLRYVGLDHIERCTRIRWSRQPSRTEAAVVTYRLSLAPHETVDFEIQVACEIGSESRSLVTCDAVLAAVRQERAEREQREAAVLTSNEELNRWIRRSSADLRMMTTKTASGPYPYAGIPWFSAPFGRDGIITALELLWAWPDMARGVLQFLADSQATGFDDQQDAQPGKILHEMRDGEMAALKEIPFGRYYGSADATPLFVMLAHAYFDRTADVEFIDRLWPNVLSALGWMESHGDPDRDGFIEYARRRDTGLVNQGWKDSQDAVFHEDGSLAEPPIALCEIQAYAYGAWTGAACLARARGDVSDASEWEERANRLRERFEEAFWCEDLGTYALALDAAKRPCRVATSNPGHCLFAGIASQDRAQIAAATLMSEASFAGWGVRTVAASQSRYNPMSYHNGSIWPHDNAIVAAGFSRYGLTAAATRIMSAMLELSQSVESSRLPELICGFHRRGSEFPTLYPVACAPQSWAAGAVYMLLGACLGLQIDAAARRLVIRRAMLPESVEWLRITNVTVLDASVDLLLTRHPYDVGVTVLRRDGHIEIVAVK
ncbi:MAG TPA: amylo-alpha-1,6-glucosidase [Vicinamibacterales bacterium]|nr:amylo-alpha-1,6-glucosidase [Vicinamibacterales bacterium]